MLDRMGNKIDMGDLVHVKLGEPEWIVGQVVSATDPSSLETPQGAAQGLLVIAAQITIPIDPKAPRDARLFAVLKLVPPGHVTFPGGEDAPTKPPEKTQ